MNDCLHDYFQSEYHTKICIRCGQEYSHFGDSSSFKNSSYEQRNMPFSIAYSRRKRFTTMLESLLFGRLTHLDNVVVEMISKDKIKFDFVEDLFKYLKKKSCTDKRYSSIHGFSRLFCRNYIKPEQPHFLHVVIKSIANEFEKIEVVFIRLFKNKPFFNYNWLLKHLLIKFNLKQYCIFVKQLKCKRRINNYKSMLESVYLDFTYTCEVDQGAPLKTL